MFALRLVCPASQADLIAAELWDRGCVAISEEERGDSVVLLAGFHNENKSHLLLERFADFDPDWKEDTTDWEKETHLAWPPRTVGERLFLSPPWWQDATPPGRVRLIHNPGTASGTGEHPCTQLVLESLEKLVKPNLLVVDIGTGSGILALAASLLGARSIGIDTDFDALVTARENFQLNGLSASLATGSADCLASACADLVLANISGSVLLSFWNDLIRVAKPGAWLILSGFVDQEAPTFLSLLPQGRLTACNEWRCLTAPLNEPV